MTSYLRSVIMNTQEPWGVWEKMGKTVMRLMPVSFAISLLMILLAALIFFSDYIRAYPIGMFLLLCLCCAFSSVLHILFYALGSSMEDIRAIRHDLKEIRQYEKGKTSLRYHGRESKTVRVVVVKKKIHS